MSDRGPVYLAAEGLGFSRYLKSLAMGENNPLGAASFAEGRRAIWASTPGTYTLLKTATSAQTTTSAGGIAYAQGIFREFIGLLRPRSLLDRIPGWRRIPANTSVLRYTSDATAALIAEGGPIPVSKFSLERVVLGTSKYGAMIVATKELLQAADPQAENSLGQQLAKAVGSATDRAAFSVDASGSITNAGVIIQSSGSTLAAIDADLKLMVNNFSSADAALDFAIWVMSPTTAGYLSLLRGSGGVNAYPDIGIRGGTLLGAPVFVSAQMTGVGSPGNNQISLIDPTQVLVNDPGAAEVTTSQNATVQQDDQPTQNSATPSGTSVVSMYQCNAVAIAALRWASWLLSSSRGAVTLANCTF